MLTPTPTLVSGLDGKTVRLSNVSMKRRDVGILLRNIGDDNGLMGQKAHPRDRIIGGAIMRRGHFDVVYTTDETRREVENRLRSRCEGGWTLRRRSGSSRSGQRDFTIVFERESDIAKLCRSSSNLQ